MSITLNSVAANNADWNEQFQFEASYDNGVTFDLIDFTGASIEIEVRDNDNCQKIQATTGNGKIVIAGVGIFELNVPESEMECLCPGSYKAGGRFILNGSTISLFTGSLSIIDGIAR